MNPAAISFTEVPLLDYLNIATIVRGEWGERSHAFTLATAIVATVY